MAEKTLANKVVDKMMEHDAFSQWLGVERLEEGPGRSVLRMTVRKEMLNGFYIAHGGITYSLADSAFAFASNSHGRKAVSIETSISHIESVHEGDVLTAEAIEENAGNKISLYHIRVLNQHGRLVALFKGTAYRTGKEWEV
ncbi:MAG: hydroxyphenylacetyl-CoA thioesterase PaaI [Saprospirales bacterium]|nr:hydroxyphenylacetyl-CoA thioesterase PaaI [Saprospirales bacterium]MBK6903163.1 hydroxyphenylacetyl-CoA thioesterase PaaI [Saprospirales bacterium]MBK7334715.1 hydroxyphenylacetyl-CoA thioesterase PaaI [Saprospirales bacterium]